MTPALDVALTAIVILGAVVFLAWKLVFASALRARRPDVPVGNLVRRKRKGGSCHEPR